MSCGQIPSCLSFVQELLSSPTEVVVRIQGSNPHAPASSSEVQAPTTSMLTPLLELSALRCDRTEISHVESDRTARSLLPFRAIAISSFSMSVAAQDLTALEKDPRLFLYTSLTAGSSHIITATSRLETILKANKIPFLAIDVATDEKARRLWGRRAGKRKLPGLVKEGFVLGVCESPAQLYGVVPARIG
jgi:hypothetical protein